MSSEQEPPTPETEKGAFVFFCYARRDKWLRDELEKHLSNLKYRGLINTWHDQEIRAGEEWMLKIDTFLNKSHIILILISADFMASEYYYGKVMTRALERHKQKEATVIPILLRPAFFIDAPFANLQMLPSNGKPITRWTNRDSAFVDVVSGIARVATKYLPPQPYGYRDLFASPPNTPRIIRRSLLSPLPLGIFVAGLIVTIILTLPLHVNIIFILIVFCSSLFASIIVAYSKAVAALRSSRRRYEEYLLYDTVTPSEDKSQMYYEGALRAYRRALLGKPSDGDLFRSMGNVLYALKRYNEALNVFQQATDHSPTPGAYAGLANVFAKLRRYSEAVAAYEKAMELDPTVTFDYDNIVESLLVLGRKEDAEQIRMRARQFGYDIAKDGREYAP